MLIPCIVSRPCIDATGLVVKAGGVAQLRPDPRAGEVLDAKTGRKRLELPEWATPVEPEKPAPPAKAKAEEKPPAK